MLTPSPEILPILTAFAPAMTQPAFQKALTLFCGTVLAVGPRTVTAALRVLGREHDNFSKYHRFFNRDRWSPMQLSRLLFLLLVRTFCAPGAPLQLVVDETLERRASRKLPYRGLFRDPVRSTASQTQYAWGLRWRVFALLVTVPWSSRPWALPFLVLPLLSEKLCKRLKKRHRTVVQWTALLLGHLRRWVPARDLILVGDGTYAAVPLVLACQTQLGSVPGKARLVSRLRLDAALHDFPEPRRPGQRGPTPKKGPRQPTLAARLQDPATSWQRVVVRWYGGEAREVELATGVALWYRGGHAPAPLRWVLVRPVAGAKHAFTPGACFCSDPEAAPEQLLAWFVARWNIEVTFAELRAHLGFETQRHWSAQATRRVTPCLCGVFSLVVVLAKVRHPEALPLPQSGWYAKPEASFVDALAAVRRDLWEALVPPVEVVRPTGSSNRTSGLHDDMCLIPFVLWQRVHPIACYAP